MLIHYLLDGNSELTLPMIYKTVTPTIYERATEYQLTIPMEYATLFRNAFFLFIPAHFAANSWTFFTVNGSVWVF